MPAPPARHQILHGPQYIRPLLRPTAATPLGDDMKITFVSLVCAVLTAEAKRSLAEGAGTTTTDGWSGAGAGAGAGHSAGAGASFEDEFTEPLDRTPPPSPALSQIDVSGARDSQQVVPTGSEEAPATRAADTRAYHYEMKTFMMDMKKMFDDFKTRQESKYTSLKNNVKELTQQTGAALAAEDLLSKQVIAVNEIITSSALERKQNRAAIRLLEDKLDAIDKYQRSTSVVIRNIPRVKRDTKDDLSEIVSQICNLVNIPLKSIDIKNIFRVATNSVSSPNNPIIVDFTTVLYRDRFVQAVKTYNKANKPNRLNTNTLGMDGPATPVFVSENLTLKLRELFRSARAFADSEHYKYCWSSRGKIYLRKTDGASLIRVHSESDLSKLKQRL